MKFGLLGFGFWGQRVARAIARVGDLHVIVDPSQQAAAARDEWGPWGTHVTTDVEMALAQCEAVWIATPVDTHARLVDAVLDAGCHVLCEKPFVLDADDAERLAEKAQRLDLALMVGHLSLYTPQYRALEGMGRVIGMETRRWNLDSSLSDHSVLWGLGPHDVATIVMTMGEPETVECEGTRHWVEARFGWKNGSSATLGLDWLSTVRWRFLTAMNYDGTTVIEDESDELVELGRPTEEPLLVEAREFYRICLGYNGRQVRRTEALMVTRTLARMEEAMNGR